MEFPNYQHEIEGDEHQDFTSTPNVTRTDKDLNVKNIYNFTDTEAQLLRGLKIRTRVVKQTETSVFTVPNNEYLISISDVGVSRTVTLPLPALAGIGKIFVIKDSSGSAATTTITVTSIGTSENAVRLDGDTTSVINANFGLKKFYSDGGSNWLST